MFRCKLQNFHKLKSKAKYISYLDYSMKNIIYWLYCIQHYRYSITFFLLQLAPLSPVLFCQISYPNIFPLPSAQHSSLAIGAVMAGIIAWSSISHWRRKQAIQPWLLLDVFHLAWNDSMCSKLMPGRRKYVKSINLFSEWRWLPSGS